MFVIEVVPFSKAAPAGSLSYRSRVRFSIGTLVSVPLRKRTVSGVVVACTSVREVKAMLKAAPFALRQGTLRCSGKIPVSYIHTAEAVARYHATTLGSVFYTLLPEILIAQKFPKRFVSGTGAHTTFVEAPYEDRICAYKKHIARAARDGSVLIVAPTAVEAKRLANLLENENTVVITGEQGRASRGKALIKAAAAKVIIATPNYSFAPIKQLSHIIIERESAGSYLNFSSPHIDWRIALRALASARSAILTYGDYPLRLEVRPAPSAPLEETLHTRIEIIDMRTKNERAVRTSFRAVPPVLLRELSRVISSGGRAVVLAARKGYAPTLVCHDCGTTVRDAHGRALALATIQGKRVLRSADGSVLRDAKALCDLCGSWNLIPLGIGVERVAEEIVRALPEAPIVRFDGDTVKTKAAALRAAANFSEPGTIIVGTESLLHWLDPAVPISLGIVSADTLLALPFWRARERFVRLALSLAEHADRLLIATRRPDDAACTALASRGAASFFKEETALRALFHYPPFGHLLIIRIKGEKNLDADEALLRAALAPRGVTRLPDRQTTTGYQASTVRTLVIKIAREEWPSPELGAMLETLPHHLSVSVDSESLW